MSFSQSFDSLRVPSRRMAMGVNDVLPGVVLCLGVAASAVALEQAEYWVFGARWLEALVLAILIGAVVRTVWTPDARWSAGIKFSAKTLLEIAVALLGASISAGMIAAAGPSLIVAIAATVVVAIGASYGIGRAFGLPHRMATLVACGNSICGNSAIAAVAPIIGASGKDVAASIAFTAALGVGVVLALPLGATALHLTGFQSGVVAGLTVYAVPQVLAAAAPMGSVAVQVGTLVKLVRVLMLGPVVLVLSLASRREAGSLLKQLPRLVPWFIVAFLAMMALRSTGMLPQAALGPMATAATVLTIVSMAALGLCTDLGALRRSGGAVVATATLSIALLGAISFGLIRLLGI